MGQPAAEKHPADRAASAGPPADGSLQVSDVSVQFGGLIALEDVSLEARPGRVLGVIGPNGAGKTTLFNVICGFTAPQAGTLVWEGRALTRLRPQRLAGLGIARTLQGVGLFPGLTVLENVMVGATHLAKARFVSSLLGLRSADRSEAELRARGLEVLTELAMAEHAERMATTLPYGLQKRTALARALVARPRLLLLDEPAGGLGADDIRELTTLIRGLRESMGVMLVEHHMDLVMDVCDDVVVLDFGRVIARGSPDQIREDPRVLEAYLGSDDDVEVAPLGADSGGGDGRT